MCLLCSCALTLLLAAACTETSLYMNSEPGDYIGQGEVWHDDATDGNFTATRNYDHGVSIDFDNFDSPASTWWDLRFAAPREEELMPGPYENAGRLAFRSPTKPGLDVSGDGRGCNELTGRFDVLLVEYGSGDEIIRFAASFEQHCEGAEPALFGEVRFHSTEDFPTPPDQDDDGVPDTMDNCRFDAEPGLNRLRFGRTRRCL